MSEPYGRLVEGGTQFRIKLDSLIDSRMLIQANSGGGKSHALRKLLEMTHGKGRGELKASAELFA